MSADHQLAERISQLEAHFKQIASERMQGLPVLHPRLRVQALGFVRHEPAPQEDGAVCCWAGGVLITPWFMNLLRLPLKPLTPLQAVESGWLASGHSGQRILGGHSFGFLGASEGDARAGGLGAFECCSLFSPMFEFTDQAAATATAAEVLRLLRSPVPSLAPAPETADVADVVPASRSVAAAAAVAAPARRAFLSGRSAAPSTRGGR